MPNPSVPVWAFICEDYLNTFCWRGFYSEVTWGHSFDGNYRRIKEELGDGGGGWELQFRVPAHPFHEANYSGTARWLKRSSTNGPLFHAWQGECWNRFFKSESQTNAALPSDPKAPKPLRSGVEEDESERLQAPALGCELGVSGLFPLSWRPRTVRSPTHWGGQTPVPLISPQPGFQLPLKVENTKGWACNSPIFHKIKRNELQHFKKTRFPGSVASNARKKTLKKAELIRVAWLVLKSFHNASLQLEDSS